MTIQSLGLIPVKNFAIVDDNLYRSAQPQYAYEYEWLHNKLGIKTIVNLRSEKDMDSVIGRKLGIKTVTIEVDDHKTPTMSQAKLFMGLIKYRNESPILFHCEHGHGRTSTFCVLARIAMGWTLDKAIEEEEKVFNYQFKHPGQKEFLVSHFGTV